MAPSRAPRTHGPKLEEDLDRTVAAHRNRPATDGIDPSLILRIKTVAPIEETEWEKLGFTVLASEADSSIVLFASDAEMTEFRRRIAAYQADPPPNQKHPQYSGFCAAIEEIGELSAVDRIGAGFRREGKTEPAAFDDAETYLADVSVWPPPEGMDEVFVHRIVKIAETAGGTVINEYRGQSAVLVRVQGTGVVIRALLDAPEAASIDPIPVPDFPAFDASNVTVETMPAVTPPAFGATTIGVIDSGLNSEHPIFAGVVAGGFGAPDTLGDADEWGHGTPISAVAVFGDVAQRVAGAGFDAQFRLASAKVVNAQGRFPEDAIEAEQITAALRRLHAEYGCKVVNMSLADKRRLVADKASAWASAIDTIARELDLVVVVPTGNANRDWLSRVYGDSIADAYPDYLFEAENRIFEPGSAVTALTVGSIAHANGLGDDDAEMVGVRPIASAGEPSPFTRTGPGLGKIVKPDFVDYGGTAVFDGPTQRLADGGVRASAGILSANARYLERLFASSSGTSLAAPLVAYKAALVRDAYPDASANLTRALLAIGADYPEAGLARLGEPDVDTALRLFGYGLVDVERSLASNDDRVVLVAEDQLVLDRFAVYEVPLVEVFQTTPGQRHIRVALAFDPPVRPSRLDYAGVGMSFDLMRGVSAQEVFDAYRKWEKKTEGDPFRLKPNKKADLNPSQTRRNAGALQCATFTASRPSRSTEDAWYLVVRCEGGWALGRETEQRYAVAVELSHQAEIGLHAKLRQRLRIQI